MKYILKSSKEIFITYILSFFILILSGLVYNFLGYNDTNYFINNISPYITIVFISIISIYLYKKNYRVEKKIKLSKYPILIHIGISISVFLNMLIFLLNKPTSIESNIPLVVLLISSGIIGPIYEEILFRYILYNRLKKKYTTRKSILITSIIFALIHLNPIKMIYAFIIGLILNVIYEKHNCVIAPILIHMSSNTIVLFLYEYNTYILLLSFINLIISIRLNNYK